MTASAPANPSPTLCALLRAERLLRPRCHGSCGCDLQTLGLSNCTLLACPASELSAADAPGVEDCSEGELGTRRADTLRPREVPVSTGVSTAVRSVCGLYWPNLRRSEWLGVLSTFADSLAPRGADGGGVEPSRTVSADTACSRGCDAGECGEACAVSAVCLVVLQQLRMIAAEVQLVRPSSLLPAIPCARAPIHIRASWVSRVRHSTCLGVRHGSPAPATCNPLQ